MAKLEKSKMLKLIKQNIQQFGCHIYVVTGGAIPRYAYTIGMQELVKAELIIAGAIYYTGDEVKRIITSICQKLKTAKKFDEVFLVDDLGSFTLRKSHNSWSSSLLLGALDYYKTSTIDAYQVVPDEIHWTIDIPNLNEAWSATTEPIWQWLHKDWSYSVSPKSIATTNIDALRGDRITEVARWEDDEWEIFAGPGPDVSYEESRVVPLGTLIAADPSLTPVVNLEIGKGLWREDTEGSEWHPWGNSPTEEDEISNS